MRVSSWIRTACPSFLRKLREMDSPTLDHGSFWGLTVGFGSLQAAIPARPGLSEESPRKEAFRFFLLPAANLARWLWRLTTPFGIPPQLRRTPWVALAFPVKPPRSTCLALILVVQVL